MPRLPGLLAVIIECVAVTLALFSLVACGGNALEDGAADQPSATAAEGTPTLDLTPTAIPTGGVTPTFPTAPPTVPPTPSPTPVPTFSVIPTVPPTPSDYPDVSYAQPTELPVIFEEEAIAIARTAPSVTGQVATLPREQFTAIYVLLTDLHYNGTNDLGTPVARNEPVWIVTAHGLTDIPGVVIPSQTPTSATAANHEMVVIIDAMTGEWVATYTYK